MKLAKEPLATESNIKLEGFENEVQDSNPTAFEQLKICLNKYYQENGYFNGFLPHELDKYSVQDSYVNLRTRENIYDKDQDTSEKAEDMELILENLFDKIDDKEIKLISLYGGAGTGKSALCQYLSVRWSKKELWQAQFDLVILLSSKDVVEGKLKFEEYFFNKYCHDFKLEHDGKDDIKSLINELFRSSKILLVIEDYDLLNSNNQKTLLDSLSTNIFLIVTSRLRLSLQSISFDRELESVGFTEKDSIEQYIKKTYDLQAKNVLALVACKTIDKIVSHPVFKEILKHPKTKIIMSCPIENISKSDRIMFECFTETTCIENDKIKDIIEQYYQSKIDKVLNFLKSNKAIEEMARTPMYLKLICFAFDEFSDSEINFSSPTITMLYRVAVKKLFESKYSSIDSHEECKSLQNSLEDIAFKKVLDESGFKKKNSEDFGEKIITEIDGIMKKNGRGEIDFAHPTFQYYFAAQYIAQNITTDNIRELIKELKYNTQYEIMWQYVAGTLYKRGETEEKQYTSLVQFWHYIEILPRDLIGFRHASLVIRCLNECTFDKLNQVYAPVYSKLLEDIKSWALSIDITECLESAPYVCEVLRKEQNFAKKLLDNFKDPEKKLFTIHISGIIGGEEQELIEAVLERVKDKTEEGIIRTTAIKALYQLKQISDEKVYKVLQDIVRENTGNGKETIEQKGVNEIEYLKNSAARELISINRVNDELIDALVNNLKNSVSKIRVVATQLLGKLGRNEDKNGEKIKKNLIDILKNAEKSGSLQKVAVVQTIGIIGLSSNDLISPLLERVNDVEEQGQVIYEAVLSLITLNKDVTDEIKESLYNYLGLYQRDDKIINLRREYAIKSFVALGKKYHDKVIKYLYNKIAEFRIQNISSKQYTTKSSALRVLGAIGCNDEKIIAILKKVHEKDRYDVKKSAAIALVGLKDIDEDVIKTLTDTVSSTKGNPYIKSEAAQLLGKLKKQFPYVISTLKDGLSNENGNIGSACAKALTGVKNEEVTNALISALKENKNSYVRSFAAQALQGVEDCDNKILYALKNALQDDESNVQSSAIQSLACSKTKDEETIEALIKALITKIGNDNYYVHRSAVESLVVLIQSNSSNITTLLDICPNKIQRYLYKLCVLSEESLSAARCEGVITVKLEERNKLLKQFKINLEISEFYLKKYPLGYSSILKIPEYTKLHIAAENGDSEAVQTILTEGKIYINDQNNTNGNAPLMVAVQQNKYETARILVKNKADINLFNNQPREHAVPKQNYNVIDILFDQITVGKKNPEILLKSLSYLKGILKMMMDLIKARQPINLEILSKTILDIKKDPTFFDRALSRLVGFESIDSLLEENVGDDLDKRQITRKQIYKFYIDNIVSMKKENQKKIEARGDDPIIVLAIRASFYLKKLLENKLSPEYTRMLEQEFLTVLEILTNIKINAYCYSEHWEHLNTSDLATSSSSDFSDFQKDLLMVDKLSEVSILNLESIIKIALTSSHADNILFQIKELKISNEYSCSFSYEYAERSSDKFAISEGHILYINFKKIEKDKVLLRIDNRLDSKQLGEPWVIKNKDGVPLIKPYLLGIITIDNNANSNKLKNYIYKALWNSFTTVEVDYGKCKNNDIDITVITDIKNILSKLLKDTNPIEKAIINMIKKLQEQEESNNILQQRQVALSKVIDSIYTDSFIREKEYINIEEKWPSFVLQAGSENCILSGHSMGVRVRGGKDFFKLVSDYEKEQIHRTST
ncbi:uncharacterized protein LOC136089301 [Hydra vulgaris]|uniref:Uncharacterized protein LOC136089301 n=1 Tax=Hydra vulgaris TaxID=6087 RepID=A0ABM4DAC2_HYDVU